MTTFPALSAHTSPGPITVAVIVTDPVTAGVLSHLHTLLPQSQLQGRPGQFSFSGEDFQPNAKGRNPCEVAGAGKPDSEGWEVQSKNQTLGLTRLPPGFLAPRGILPFRGMFKVGSPSKCWS